MNQLRLAQSTKQSFLLGDVVLELVVVFSPIVVEQRERAGERNGGPRGTSRLTFRAVRRSKLRRSANQVTAP